MSLIEFFVPGKPAPGGSKSAFYIKKSKRIIMTPASKFTKPWMATVSAFAKEVYQGPLLTGAIELSIEFRFCRPKGHYGTGRNANLLKASAPKYHTGRPDSTKCLRSTEDAMEGIIYRNDSQIASHHIRKIYVERDCGAMIILKRLNGVPEPVLPGNDKDLRKE